VLRMSGAKPLLPLYAFTAWTGNTFLTLFLTSLLVAFTIQRPLEEELKNKE